MLTLDETLASQANLQDLCADRPQATQEIFTWNDFYGMGSILKKYAGLPQTYPLKVIVPHGVLIREGYDTDAVATSERNSILPAVLCYPDYRQPAYASQTDKLVIPAASPFLYLTELMKPAPKPERKGLIYFPAHSTHYRISYSEFDVIADQLEELDDEFKPVTVCIYWKDYSMGRHLPFQKKGFKIVSAGHMFDPLFPLRFYHLCSMHKYAAANNFSSHIFYTVASGCSYFQFGPDVLKIEELKHIEYISNIDPEIQKKLAKTFDSPQYPTTQEQQELVNDFLGARNLQTPQALYEQLMDAEKLFNEKKKSIVVDKSGALYPHSELKAAAMDDYRNGNRESAAQLYQKLLEQTPNDTDALFNLGKILFDLKNYTGSIHFLIRYLKINSLDVEAWLGIALAARQLQDKGLFDQACSQMRNLGGNPPEWLPALAGSPALNRPAAPAVQAEGQKVSQLVALAQQQLNNNQPELALQSVIQAKSLRQPVQGLDYLRSLCFYKMNQVESVRQALLEELRYYPGNEQARQFLAQIPASQVAGATDPEFRQVMNVIQPYTMLSEKRLYSLFTLAKEICTKNIPGNFVECGVAAGGSTALLAYVIKRYSRQPRLIYAFDSFEGMPDPTEEDTHRNQAAQDTGWGSGTCAAGIESVREIAQKLDVQALVKPIKGLFQDTLPELRDWVGMVAFLHMDGDWYESTKAILENLYDRVSDDGIIQVDDYGFWEGCSKAIHEFETSRHLKFDINSIDGTGVWIKKPDRFPLNPKYPQMLVNKFLELQPSLEQIGSQMSPNERFQLFYLLHEILPKRKTPTRFIEIGSYTGASLFLITSVLHIAGHQVQGFAVDIADRPQLMAVINHLKTFADINFLKGTFTQAKPGLTDIFNRDGNFPEVILIDGDHTYEGVKQDIIHCYPLLAPGGYMIFHDYLPPLDEKNREAIFSHHGNKEPGIRQACQEMMEDTYHCRSIEIPLLYPTNPEQTQAHLPIIPGVFSSIKIYEKTK